MRSCRSPDRRRGAARTQLIGAALQGRMIAGITGMQAVDRAREIVDPIESERQVVLAILAQAHDGDLRCSRRPPSRPPPPDAPPARRHRPTGNRRKPNELLKPACIAWAGDALIDTARASPDDRCSCITAPCACLSNMMTSDGSKSGCSDCSAMRLVQAKLSEAALKKPKASGPVCRPTAVTASDMVWNNRLWSAPLVQPPWPSGLITSGLLPNDICGMGDRGERAPQQHAVRRAEAGHQIVARPGVVAEAGRRDRHGHRS